MQFNDFADWQSQNGGIGQNIDDAVSVPKDIAVGATRIFNSFVPECCHGDTLEDGGKQRTDGPADDNKQICEAKPSEDLAHEYSEVEKENGDLVKTKDQLVKDLRKIEPL